MKPEPDPLLALLFELEPDFASEHCDFTVGDRERGGPEGIVENESPKGYGGADIHRSRRPRNRPALKTRPRRRAEPALTDTEPDFAMEHRHLSVGGADVYHDRRRP